jgi:hypothetical protein
VLQNHLGRSFVEEDDLVDCGVKVSEIWFHCISTIEHQSTPAPPQALCEERLAHLCPSLIKIYKTSDSSNGHFATGTVDIVKPQTLNPKP